MATQTQPLTAAQAHNLAEEFHDIAAAIGAYRLAQVSTLTDTQQYQLQNLQLQCVQYSTGFITLGLFAQQANLVATLQTITKQTTAAQQAISTINTIDKVLQIATAAAVLGASIASMNALAVGSGIQGLITAVTATPTASGGTSATTSPKQSSETPGD
jgi:hypothetical protein